MQKLAQKCAGIWLFFSLAAATLPASHTDLPPRLTHYLSASTRAFYEDKKEQCHLKILDLIFLSGEIKYVFKNHFGAAFVLEDCHYIFKIPEHVNYYVGQRVNFYYIKEEDRRDFFVYCEDLLTDYYQCTLL